jgi:hypothetical protein
MNGCTIGPTRSPGRFPPRHFRQTGSVTVESCIVISTSMVRTRRGPVIFLLKHRINDQLISNKPVEARPPAARAFPAKEGRLLSFFDCRQKICEVTDRPPVLKNASRIKQETWKFAEVHFSTGCLIEMRPNDRNSLPVGQNSRSMQVCVHLYTQVP